MKKIKIMKLKLNAAIVVGIVIGLVALFGGVKAYQSYGEAPKVVNEAGGIVNFNEASPVLDTFVSDELGAVSSPYLSSNVFSVNGDITYHLTQTFQDATTTLVSIPNPFLTVSTTNSGAAVLRTDGLTQWVGATSTVELARLYITGAATSSLGILCGAASTPTAIPSVAIVSTTASWSIATSSIGVIENNVTAAQGGLVDVGTVAKIMLNTALPYFNCRVDAQVAAAVTQATNTLDGKIIIRVSRQQ
jgi:hypothetical protein